MKEKPHRRWRAAVATYDGRDLLGSVRQIDTTHFEAADRDGRVLGIYRNRRAAAAALPDHEEPVAEH
jgi:hypothetical protein